MVTPERFQRISVLFREVMRAEPATRVAMLDRACGGDEELRSEVERLLQVDSSLPAFVHDSVVGAMAERRVAAAIAGPDPAPAGIPERIGPFEIEALIGTGGMGAVYRARQASPRRTVAVKVLRPGLFSAAMARRFEHEIEMLGRLRHPGIAQVFDAGTWHDGHETRRWLAMELVEGEPLTRFADARGLSVRERMLLFTELCEAVEHAHQKGVIHRDLKPGNILVGADGRSKVLDFGIARETDRDVQGMTLQTEVGQILGTLPYMSPEQLAGDARDVDTRSDVYSLGVILYELVAGQRPYEVGGLSLAEAARVVCEQAPHPAGAHQRALRGDVETIVHKALEKDPARRYASAAALADDIRRHLDHRPILAHPPSTAYQLRVLVRRHRLASTILAALVFVIAGSSILTGWLAIGLFRQRDAARVAQKAATTEGAAAEEFAGFLQRLFERANPGTEVKDPTLRQLLDEGFAGASAIRDPAARARVMTVLGRVYARLDNLPRARELLESALQIRRGMHGGDHSEVAEGLLELTRFLMRQHDHTETDATAAEATDMLLRLFGERDIRVADAWTIRGEGRFYAADFAGAVSHFRNAMAIQREVDPRASAALAASISNVGKALTKLKEFDEAERHLREALSMCRQLNDVSETLLTMEGLAQMLWQRGDTRGAERVYADELEIARAEFRPGHPRLAWVLSNYAFTVGANQGPERAEPLFREAVQINREAFSADPNRETARCLKLLGANLRRQGKETEARAAFLESAEILTRLFGAENEATIATVRLIEGPAGAQPVSSSPVPAASGR